MGVRTFADDYSTQVAKHDLVAANYPGNPLRQPDDKGQVFAFRFDHTQGSTAGDATSTQGLVYLPAGRWRFIGAFLDSSAFGTSRTLDIGLAAYTKHDGSTVNADPDAFVNDKDVSAALVGWGANVDTAQQVIECVKDVLIYSTVAGGTIPAAATIKGVMLFAKAE